MISQKEKEIKSETDQKQSLKETIQFGVISQAE